MPKVLHLPRNCNLDFAKSMKNKQQDIEHLGEIVGIQANVARIRIIQNSACSACHAKGGCSAADSAEKEVEAMIVNQKLAVGDKVMVTGRSVLGLEAVMYAYLLPFLFLFTTLLTVFAYTENELIAAVSAIGSIIPYYAILFLFKNKFSKKFTFFIKQIIS